jgi:hypothetical protein
MTDKRGPIGVTGVGRSALPQRGPGGDGFHGPVPNQVLECGQWDADMAADVDEADSTLRDEAAGKANGGAEQFGGLVYG